MKRKDIALTVAIILIIGIILVLKMMNTESGDFEKKELTVVEESGSETRLAQKAAKYPRAVELDRPDGYLNVENITIGEHIGKKVILVDFWTYSCINCQRTLPYLTAWWEQYKDQGLVIIGVHTPEFDFEKTYENVQRAMEKFGVTYPVVQDNEFRTWRAYGNRYWPRKYIIDIDGFIVYDHIGEGSYDETEEKIQELLLERKEVLGTQEEVSSGMSSPEATKPDFKQIGTPEIYFGYKFDRGHLGNIQGRSEGQVLNYTVPKKFLRNRFYLEGEWLNNQDDMQLVGETGRIIIPYKAKNVNFVAGADEPSELTILLDGEEIDRITVKEFDLYTLVAGDEYAPHDLEIRATKGLRAYTFTFG